jgi:hypothetical protein
MKPCSLLGFYRVFVGAYFLHLHSRREIFLLQDRHLKENIALFESEYNEGYCFSFVNDSFLLTFSAYSCVYCIWKYLIINEMYFSEKYDIAEFPASIFLNFKF